MAKSLTFKSVLSATLLCFGVQAIFAQAIPCETNPDKIICDNFESYNVGVISPQSLHWAPWSGSETGSINAEVTTEQASDGTKSMKVVQNDDQLLLLGNKTTGRYSLKWMMYVPAGKAAYFNIQNSQTAGQQWNGEFYFGTDTTGTATEAVNNQIITKGKFTYPKNEWFSVEIIIDLDNDFAKVFVGDQLSRGYHYPGNIGSIDYYGADATYTFYVDQVEYVGLPALVFNADNCPDAEDITKYFDGLPNVPTLTGLYNNTTATVDAQDPDAPECWDDGFPAAPAIDGSMWFTFTGNGGKYHIETVPCSAVDYIDDGDTQMALYTGECGGFSQLDCNEDLAAAVDFRAGLDVETTSGTDYHLLIDGWGDQGMGFVSTGEFCIQVTRYPDVTCDLASAGNYTLTSNFVCNGADVAGIINLDASSVLIPNFGDVWGMGWAITTEPVPAGVWPPSLGAAPAGPFLGSTRFIQSPIVISFPNVNLNLTDPIILYFTPVVIGNGSSVVADPFMSEVDTTGACFVVGESSAVIYVPLLDPLVGTATFSPVTAGNDGAIDLTVSGGFYEFLLDPSAYTVAWTGPNGFTSDEEDPSGLEPGTYVATVSDVTGCVDDITVTVSLTTSVKDPASVKSLMVMPNPTPNLTTVSLELAQAAEVRIELLNTLGQTLETINAGKASEFNREIDLSRVAGGTYFLRVTIDGETALRRVVRR